MSLKIWTLWLAGSTLRDLGQVMALKDLCVSSGFGLCSHRAYWDSKEVWKHSSGMTILCLAAQTGAALKYSQFNTSRSATKARQHKSTS